jgi:hypothetical protein
VRRDSATFVLPPAALPIRLPETSVSQVFAPILPGLLPATPAAAQ